MAEHAFCKEQATNGVPIQLSGSTLIPHHKENLMKRNHEIKIRLSECELDSLNSKVQKTRLSREEFCRQALALSQVKEAPSEKVITLMRDVANIRDRLAEAVKDSVRYGITDDEEINKLIERLLLVQWTLAEIYFYE